MVGLGWKRRTEETGKDSKNNSSGSVLMKQQLRKAKTLYEKRINLEHDILRYGVAAIEKLYPRQQHNTSSGHPHHKKSKTSPRPTPIKMKPKPIGFEYEEVDARQILKPQTHDKYIHEPAYDSVVYISRRKGLVPLSSLSRESKTILSSNVRLLSGRNVRLGKPSLFVKDKDRLLAIGGSRRQLKKHINILRVPQLIKQKNPTLVPFEMDDEFVFNALRALRVPKKKPKIDIRTIKKMKKGKSNNVTETVSSKSIVDLVFEKIKKATKAEEELKKEEQEKQQLKNNEVNSETNIENGSQNSEASSTVLSEHSSNSGSDSEFSEDSQDINEIDDRMNIYSDNLLTFNKWSMNLDPFDFNNFDEDEPPKPSDDFLEAFNERKRNGSIGYENCDVDDCFCKVKVFDMSPMATEQGTPVTGAMTPKTGVETPKTGAQTPKANYETENDKKVRKNLSKVKRALKTLGVNIIEFDENKDKRENCDKEYCRLGCVCESIMSKPIPPAHCGKEECMFQCNCSEESVKYSTARKVGISPAACAKLQENSQRNLAAEERKFHNTVVTTGGRDIVMLGSSGRQKRERKVPTRYQDSDTLMLDASGKEYVQKIEEIDDAEDYLVEDHSYEKMVTECLKSERVQKCAVLMPLVKLPQDIQVWCMYHCQYNCPCHKFKSPLDFGPDKNRSRNVGRRSTKPKTKKILSPRKSNSDFENLAFHNPEKTLKRDHTGRIKCDDFGKVYDTAFGNCARTSIWRITPSGKVKMPHKLVSASKKLEEKKENHVWNVLQVIGKPALIASNILEGEPKLNEEVVDLNLAPKETNKIVKLSEFKLKYHENAIRIWTYYKNLESTNGDVKKDKLLNVLIVTNANSKPYIRDAVDISTVNDTSSDYYSPLLGCLKGPLAEKDSRLYVQLVSNGIAWIVRTLIQRKNDPLKNNPSKKSANDEVSVIENESTQKSASVVKQCEVSIDCKVQELPVGQNLVTITKDKIAMLRIKLPPTTSNQNWCVLRLDSSEGSIQCPNSTLALKRAVLQQAASLSAKENTTVRIPIPVPGEVQTFGVYAVPGLQSHVFVGPFTSKKVPQAMAKPTQSNNEIICLDDEEEIKTIDEELDDEIQILPQSDSSLNQSTSSRRKQKLTNLLDEDDKIFNSNVVKGIVDDVVEKSVRNAERKQKRLTFKKRAIVGQVPQMVINCDADENEQIVEIAEQQEKENNQSTLLKQSVTQQVKENPQTILNCNFSSQFGKVYMMSGSSTNNASRANGSWASINIPEADNSTLLVVIQTNDKVRFPHPALPNHEVICQSLENAKKWYIDYTHFKKNGVNQEKMFDSEQKQPSSPPPQQQQQQQQQQQKQELGIPHEKPFPNIEKLFKLQTSAVNESKSCTPVLKTATFDNGEGQTGVAILLQRNQNEMEPSKLYHDLGRAINPVFFQRNLSRVQILQKAKDQAIFLKNQFEELEHEKKELTLKRVELFGKFTKNLEGLPVTIKKRAVLELKENLRKSKEIAAEEKKKVTIDRDMEDSNEIV